MRANESDGVAAHNVGPRPGETRGEGNGIFSCTTPRDIAARPDGLGPPAFQATRATTIEYDSRGADESRVLERVVRDFQEAASRRVKTL